MPCISVNLSLLDSEFWSFHLTSFTLELALQGIVDERS